MIIDKSLAIPTLLLLTYEQRTTSTSGTSASATTASKTLVIKSRKFSYGILRQLLIILTRGAPVNPEGFVHISATGNLTSDLPCQKNSQTCLADSAICVVAAIRTKTIILTQLRPSIQFLGNLVHLATLTS